jgi:hypothetical protein
VPAPTADLFKVKGKGPKPDVSTPLGALNDEGAEQAIVILIERHDAPFSKLEKLLRNKLRDPSSVRGNKGEPPLCLTFRLKVLAG